MIEHLAFEQLDAVDVSFDDARVPRQGEAGGGGIEVAADACGERVEAGRAVLSDGVEPVRQAFAWCSVSVVAKARTGRMRASSTG
ncbi:hypothetical protein ACIPJN_17520 [Streptomyces sp. NPDC086796]|uniref:hypothetical protein n=1 Tax=unclassified Streptomyces TaxID=2593676 RepID=UPI0038169BE1